jgi:hypothetical protein
LCSSLNVRQVSHPYRTTGLICSFAYSELCISKQQREDRRFWTYG